jgi:hypothetical protein
LPPAVRGRRGRQPSRPRHIGTGCEQQVDALLHQLAGSGGERGGIGLSERRG